MNDGRLTVKISGREALPVRAIPYVAGLRFPADVLVNCLARNEELSNASRSAITAYRIIDNAPVRVIPREWKLTVAKLKGFEAQLRQQHPHLDIGNAVWRCDAMSNFPKEAFVWLDEFENEYQVDKERVSFSDARSGDDELLLAPMMDAITRTMVMEGFEAYTGVTKQLQNVESASAKDEAVSIATTESATMEKATPVGAVNTASKANDVKPWNIANPNDPNPEQLWYTPARYFARQLVKDDTSLLTKRNLLADKIVQSLTNAGFKKRGGKKPFTSGTILKALSNVFLG